MLVSAPLVHTAAATVVQPVDVAMLGVGPTGVGHLPGGPLHCRHGLYWSDVWKPDRSTCVVSCLVVRTSSPVLQHVYMVSRRLLSAPTTVLITCAMLTAGSAPVSAGTATGVLPAHGPAPETIAVSQPPTRSSSRVRKPTERSQKSALQAQDNTLLVEAPVAAPKAASGRGRGRPPKHRSGAASSAAPESLPAQQSQDPSSGPAPAPAPASAPAPAPEPAVSVPLQHKQKASLVCKAAEDFITLHTIPGAKGALVQLQGMTADAEARLHDMHRELDAATGLQYITANMNSRIEKNMDALFAMVDALGVYK